MGTTMFDFGPELSITLQNMVLNHKLWAILPMQAVQGFFFSDSFCLTTLWKGT